MPLYEYECQSCHKHLEKIRKFSDPPLTECPHCGGHLEQTITAPAVQFKGGGWYADLYSSSKGGKKSDGGTSTSGSEGGSTSSSSESAPAASTAPAATAPAAAPSAPAASPTK